MEGWLHVTNQLLDVLCSKTIFCSTFAAHILKLQHNFWFLWKPFFYWGVSWNPPPRKLLCISDHNSLIYSICCKFFILVPICYKRLQQPLFFIFKNFPHFLQVKPWYKVQHPWTLNIFKRFSKRFCSKDAAIYSKRGIFCLGQVRFSDSLH